MRYLKTFEQFVNEAKIENESIENSISEFHQLQNEIAELEMQLKEKKNQFKQFDSEITPILDGMKETKDKLAYTEEYVVKISRFGHDRTSASYKDAFELSLTKVNAATKRILEEALESTQKITKIGHSYKIEKLNEANIFQVVLDKLKSIAKSFLNIFKKESKNIDNANDELKKLSTSKMNEDFLNEQFKKGDTVALGAPHYMEELLSDTGKTVNYDDVFKVTKVKGKTLTIKGSDSEFDVPAKYFVVDESVINEEVENYMFFQNLKSIKEKVEKILALNEEEVDAIISDGHSWAIDHISTSKDDIDEVANFLTHNSENPTI